MIKTKTWWWQTGFIVILLFYALIYGPYGLSDTDGGFITGLAWEVLNGKILYKDLSYVRPPLPIWLRSLELYIMPDWLEIRAERWLFYIKMAVIATCVSGIFSQYIQRWPLAIAVFVLSTHCYPPAAWHTVDGVFFAAIGFYFLQRASPMATALAMFSALCSELSKQVFQITPLLFIGWLLIHRAYKRAMWACLFYAFGKCFFIALLYQQGTLTTYQKMIQGANSMAALWQHGVRDFLDMPWLFWVMLVVFGLLRFGEFNSRGITIRKLYVAGLVLLLVLSYIYQVYNRQVFTAPFSQARLLWWIGLAGSAYAMWKKERGLAAELTLCSGINWASAVSWGYNLPIFFPVAGLVSLARFWPDTPTSGTRSPTIAALAGIATVMICFAYGYQFIYRDGHRSDMQFNMGQIYPKLAGIYTDSSTYTKYEQLSKLQTKYPQATVLPSMTLANYLQNRVGYLPQQWVVEREFGFESWSPWLEQCHGKVFLVEKNMLVGIKSDSQYAFTQTILEDGYVLEETEWFLVVRMQKGSE